MKKFPIDFIFGTATSSYQVEGAKNLDGKTDSIWDTFTRKEGAISDKSNADTACDHYHLYKNDIKLMKELGIETYRLSISWPRIIPSKGVVNKKGIEFYKKLFIALQDAGIKISVTMYHWDLPEWIYQENGGWNSRDIVTYFVEYAEVLYKEFDKYVEQWVTLNEPYCSSLLGYLYGIHAPGHKDEYEYFKSHHYLLLAHGYAVKKYRELGYKKEIGIVLNPSHVYTDDYTEENKLAIRYCDGLRNRFFYDPLFKGNYPSDVMELAKKLLPDLSFIQSDDLKIIQEPIDFLGINYYTWDYVEYCKENPRKFKHIETKSIKTTMGWDITPKALYDLVVRIREEYTNIPIYVTENGSAWEDTIVDGKVNDVKRVDYLNKHLEVVHDLIEKDMNIAGYYLWSFLDNFEWAHGYTQRFGIVHVNYDTQKRIPKQSYYRYQEIIKNRAL